MTPSLDSVTKPTEPTKVSDAPISMPPKNSATPSSSTATPTSGAPTVSGKPSPKSFQTKIDFSKYDPNWKNNCDVAVDAETKNPNRDEQQSKVHPFQFIDFDDFTYKVT